MNTNTNTDKAVTGERIPARVERLRHASGRGSIEYWQKLAMDLSKQVAEQTSRLQDAEAVIRSALDVMRREGGNDSAVARLEHFMEHGN